MKIKILFFLLLLLILFIISSCSIAEPRDDVNINNNLTVNGISTFNDLSEFNNNVDINERLVLSGGIVDNGQIYFSTDGNYNTIFSDGTNLYIRAPGNIYFQPSHDNNDYIRFLTDGNVPSIYGAGSYLSIGNGSFTNHGLSHEDDLMATGKLEVLGLSYFDSDAWFSSDVSANTFTDRTKWYYGDALLELSNIKGKNGDIDHSTLPEFTKVYKQKPIYEYGTDNITKYEYVIERDIGATLSMCIVAIQQLNQKVIYLESKINELKGIK